MDTHRTGWRRACALMFLSVVLAGAPARAETEPRVVRDFGESEYFGLMTQGLDGRLYGLSDQLASVNPEDGELQRHGGSDLVLWFSGTGGLPSQVASLRGWIYGAAGPQAWEPDPQALNITNTICPTIKYMPDASSPLGNRTDLHTGSLYRYSATTAVATLPVSTAVPICPNGVMRTDADGALYFFSTMQIAKNRHPDGAVVRLMRLSPDGTQLIELVRQPDEGPEFSDLLLVQQSGSWIYGNSRAIRRNSAGNDYEFQDELWRVRKDGTGFEVIERSGYGARNSGAYRLFEGTDFLYGVRQEGSGASAKVELVRMELDGSGRTSLLTLPFSSSPELVQSMDGHFYGAMRSGGTYGKGLLFRIVLGDGAPRYETLFEYPGTDMQEGGYYVGHPRGRYPGSLVAGVNGKIYGMSSQPDGSSPNRLFELDTGYVPAAPVVTAYADPAEVSWAEDGTRTGSTVHWNSQGAVGCTADWLGGAEVGPQGSSDVMPEHSGDNTYTLTCRNGNGDVRSISVVVMVSAAVPAPTVSLWTEQDVAELGGTLALRWQTTHALGCAATGQWSGGKALDETGAGSEIVQLRDSATEYTATFTLTCTGAGGTASKDFSIPVVVPAGEPDTVAVREGGGSAAWLLCLMSLLLFFKRLRRFPHNA